MHATIMKIFFCRNQELVVLKIWINSFRSHVPHSKTNFMQLTLASNSPFKGGSGTSWEPYIFGTYTTFRMCPCCHDLNFLEISLDKRSFFLFLFFFPNHWISSFVLGISNDYRIIFNFKTNCEKKNCIFSQVNRLEFQAWNNSASWVK